MARDDGVAAVDRALSILDAFDDHEHVFTLAEIARRTGLYKSTVLRLARSLEKYGYLLRTEDGLYHLGSKVFYLGSIYQRHFRTASIVPPVLRAIVDELREGASFYVRDGDQRICLHRVDSARSVRDSVHEGARLPLKLGAASHVIRAFEGAAGERSEQVRRDFYAASFGERDPEVSAVACPVFGLNQRFIGALAVSGPRYRIDAGHVEPIVRSLFRHAAGLTSAFGGDASVYPSARSRADRSRGKRRTEKVS
ncbi:MAG TPA: IclR family transcriptional regulator [Casimicrobiaceae bacterium]|jgi:DNA-binding IclR family transcriptional regulator